VSQQFNWTVIKTFTGLTQDKLKKHLIGREMEDVYFKQYYITKAWKSPPMPKNWYFAGLLRWWEEARFDLTENC